MVKMSYYTDYSNYTDWHEVDEDMRTSSLQGGNWIEDRTAGITQRYIVNTSTLVSFDVASRCCTIRKK